MKTYIAKFFVAAAFGLGVVVGPVWAGMTTPKVITEPQLVYPAALAKAGVEGAVLVHFHIAPSGSTREVSVVASTDRVFEAAAMAALRQATYEPARKDGAAVESEAVQLVVFRLEGSSTDTSDATLANKLQPRYGYANGVPHMIDCEDPCICGSGKPYNRCHHF